MSQFAGLFAEGEPAQPMPAPGPTVLPLTSSLGVLVCYALVLYLPSFLALVRLRDRRLSDTATAVWAFLIVLLPWLGSIAFWLVRPTPATAETQPAPPRD